MAQTIFSKLLQHMLDNAKKKKIPVLEVSYLSRMFSNALAGSKLSNNPSDLSIT